MVASTASRRPSAGRIPDSRRASIGLAGSGAGRSAAHCAPPRGRPPAGRASHEPGPGRRPGRARPPPQHPEERCRPRWPGQCGGPRSDARTTSVRLDAPITSTAPAPPPPRARLRREARGPPSRGSRLRSTALPRTGRSSPSSPSSHHEPMPLRLPRPAGARPRPRSADRNGEVEGAAGLGHVGRRQVDRDTAVRDRKPCAGERGRHPFAAFAHRPGRQADDRKRREAGGQARLDADRKAVDPAQGGRSDLSEHRPPQPCIRWCRTAGTFPAPEKGGDVAGASPWHDGNTWSYAGPPAAGDINCHLLTISRDLRTGTNERAGSRWMNPREHRERRGARGEYVRVAARDPGR